VYAVLLADTVAQTVRERKLVKERNDKAPACPGLFCFVIDTKALPSYTRAAFSPLAMYPADTYCGRDRRAHAIVAMEGA
jgi:hypothetical protein